MLCKNPFVPSAGAVFGCGQCLPCRFNRRRIWQHRMLLEAMQYSHSAFVTLTYRDEELPEGNTLVPTDLQRWLKRLRFAVAPSRLRFFAVGEYGDVSNRPHYHAALFGFPGCAYGRSRYSASVTDCCHWCDLVRDTWGHGNVYVGSLERDSAGYLAGYVTKKMTSKDDPRLKGRHPEFGRMSRRPGIGHDAMFAVADVILKHGQELTEVPSQLMHGKKMLPLGRYLRRRLRLMVGQDEKITQEAFDALSEELFALRLAAREDAENPSVKAHLIAENAGRVASFEVRSEIFKQRRGL